MTATRTHPTPTRPVRANLTSAYRRARSAACLRTSSTGPHPGRAPATMAGTKSNRWTCSPAAEQGLPRCRPRPGRASDRRGRFGRLGRAAWIAALAAVVVLVSAGPAAAAPPASLDEVISRITAWLVRLAAGLATLFLTYGAVRLLTAGGDPGNVEKAKTALRGAALGYGLALLAPLIVTVLTSFVA